MLPVEGIRLTEEMVKIRKNKLGKDHPDILGSMYDLANQYSEAAKFLTTLSGEFPDGSAQFLLELGDLYRTKL